MVFHTTYYEFLKKHFGLLVLTKFFVLFFFAVVVLGVKVSAIFSTPQDIKNYIFYYLVFSVIAIPFLDGPIIGWLAHTQSKRPQLFNSIAIGVVGTVVTGVIYLLLTLLLVFLR